ncbi:S8 family serine peptidase [Streptosporangium sp. NBC_01756]|uniref:S8 family serine peptidase n=1 Tax=Streptosporangium sp. NBC_01756 TaxID=2975950 RepID=UPI002DDAB1AC|nr:S8 family serine peptidase [Streptosporangium sp. NBC_01756]WSC85683.1 S8 family serine peptidase [Streptosporangium sp. NBC_01756]
MKTIRKALGAAAALALMTFTLAPAPAAQAALASRVLETHATSDRVLETYATSETASFWVRMADKADLSAARKMMNRTTRGQDVADRLKSTADRSQAPLRKLLKAEGLTSKAFWASNAVYVEDAPESVAREIAALPGVEEIRPSKTYTIPKPVAGQPAATAETGLAWGVSNINADDVWAQTGRRGEGIVVANVDTGVQFDHPALVKQYRGNNGDGTFTHDYNWINPSNNCESAAPCDTHGHGSHTMGTIAGDDGAGNQIGVAPGVTWIAGNGCPGGSCPDTDLLAVSQWMLAPTDLSGENPDVSKRPHIVNNSWGSNPSDDPLMEDIQLAWAASGIMGVWANGNEGPGCKTSGSPGSRSINYSVGAYDANNKIASFSSRGPGQDGQIKPNISAPGVNIRSVHPDGGYVAMNGTSMATPHVTGAIALLWSARPEYARDPDATRVLLDLSAIDTADTSCGGTAADNNVYGEGRLDALALIQVGATGSSTVAGTVTDAGTGRSVAGAALTITGPLTRTTTLGTEGTYSFSLVAGDYQISVTAFGYQTGTRAVTLTKDGNHTVDIALVPTQRVDLTGTVTDGSGLGRPLPASVVADDGKGHRWSADADPGTGAYTLPLLPATTYTLTYTTKEPGYDPATRRLDLGETGQRLDVGLTVNLACTASGYQVSRDGSTQPFNGTTKPKGWTVTNVDIGIPNYDHQPGWVFKDAGKRGNHTGGDGGFAIVDSRNSGIGHIQDTYLTSPAYDLTGRTQAAIELAHDLKPAVNSTATIELSLDGGRTWDAVWSVTRFPGAPGPATQVVPIPQANGKTGVKFRLYYQGQLSGWWAVDNAFVGDRTCTLAAKG